MKAKILINLDYNIFNVDLKYMIGSQEQLFNIETLDFVPKKGDKIYLLPGVNVPRVKVKQFNEDNGTKTVRDLNVADYIFGCDKTQEEYFVSSNMWVYNLPVAEFNKLIPYLSSAFQIDPTDISDVKDIIEAHALNNDELNIYYNYSTLKNLKEIINNNKINIIDSFDDSNTYKVIDNEYINEIETLETLTIYNVNALSSAINSKNVIIDYEMFGQLTNMLDSNDRDNHVLAMEIMANSNVNESLLFIEMLFKDHSYNIYDSHTRNHVNFKSLCSLIGKEKYRYSTDIDDIIKSLKTFNVLTADKLDILMNHYSKEIQQSGNTDYFQVKNITVTDEIHNILNQNYVFSIQNDYIPVIEKEVFVEDINIESLNIESVEENISLELKNINVIHESEETVRVIETVREENVLPFVENTIEDIKDIEEQVDINPVIKEEDESNVDWF